MTGYYDNSIATKVRWWHSDTIDPDFTSTYQGILSAFVYQSKLTQKWPLLWRAGLEVVWYEMECFIYTVFDKGVLAVTLEVVPIVIKGQVVGVTPNTAHTGDYKKSKIEWDKRPDLCFKNLRTNTYNSMYLPF